MNWSLAISGVPTNPANYLVAALYDPSAPGTPYTYQTVPKPGGGYTGAAITIIFIGVNAIVYNFVLYESISSTPAGTVMSAFSFQPSANTAQIRADNFILPDITPGVSSGGTAVVDTSLAGWTYRVELIGYDTLQPGVDYVQDSTGGWHLINGRVFAAGDIYVEQFQPLIVIANNAPNLIKSTVILTAATTLDASYVGQAILLQGAGATLPITLPPLSSITDNQLIMLYSGGGNHINSVISCASSDKIQWWASSGSQLVTKLILGQMEQLEIFKFTPSGGTATWFVKVVSPGVSMVGEVIYKYSKVDMNTLFADGAPGGPLLRANYPRMVAYMLSLDPSELVSESSWNAIDGSGNLINRGKWSTGDGATTFRPPQLFTAAFLAAVDGSTRMPGSFQKDGVGAFNAKVTGVILAKSGTNNRVITLGNISDASLGTQQTATALPFVGDSLKTQPTNFGVYALIRC